MAGKATAIDPGSHTIKVLALKSGKHGLAVERFAVVPAADGGAALAATGIPLKGVTAGLAGREMTLRYTQVPPSPDWQLRNLMELEIQDLSSQSGGALSADYNLLPLGDEESGMDTVLLALARNEALERTSGMVAEAGGSVAGHVPNCIAVYNAYLRGGPVEEDAVVCLANIGNETTDIALVRGTDLLFARNLSGGGKVLDDAIAGAFNVSARKAESLKRDLLDLDPASRGRYASGQAEKVTMAAGGAASMIVSGIQSSLAFCQSQTKIKDLRLDKVLVCGGGARVRGLRGMLREALRCPVEPFDPFESCDLSALPAAEAEALRQYRPEAVIALGLAAGKVDDSLYALEILPEAVKRRRRFQQRTVWNIAAGVVGVAVLALIASGAAANQTHAQQAASKVARDKQRYMRTHEQAEKIAKELQDKRDLVDLLAEKAVPLHGTLRALRALEATLQRDLWVKSLEVVQRVPTGTPAAGSVPGVGAGIGASGPRQARYLVEIKGEGKEVSGRNLNDVYSEFSSQFRNHELVRKEGVVATPQPDPAGLSFKIELDFRPPPLPTTTPQEQGK